MSAHSPQVAGARLQCPLGVKAFGMPAENIKGRVKNHPAETTGACRGAETKAGGIKTKRAKK